MTTFTIGIDPGASGAVAIVETKTGKLIDVFDMPAVEVRIGNKLKRRVSPEMLAAELEHYAREESTCWIEQVGAMPGQGVTSMFAFGESAGLARGVLAGLRIPVFQVTPSTWKKSMKVNASKDGSRAKAAQIWPDKAGEFKRVKDDGRAEAALIAAYGVQQP